MGGPLSKFAASQFRSKLDLASGSAGMPAICDDDSGTLHVGGGCDAVVDCTTASKIASFGT
jgi:hypothetical protein